MTEAEVKNILNKGEGRSIEYKESESNLPSNLYESIVSLSNTDGGSIILGADNDGNITGINPESISKIKTDLATALNSPECVSPSLFITPLEFSFSEGVVLLLQIPASSQVHKHASKVYIREGDADIDITDNQHAVTELYLRKKEYFSETKIYPHLALDDLDENLFNLARSIIKSNKPSHPWVNASNEQILNESSLYRKDHQTGEEGLTLAAGLIFGKDGSIQSLLPAYKVELLIRKIDLNRYDDRRTFRTNLIETYQGLLKLITEYLPEKFHLEDGQRKDLRDIIFREIIGNIIVHREYTNAHSSEIIVYKDKVVATNPNKPLFHGPIDLHSFNPYPKNPNIRRFFTAFGWTDEIGSGIRNTTKYLKIYVPGAEPIFFENDLFRTEIPLVSNTFTAHIDDLISWFDFPSEAKVHLSTGLSRIQLDSALAEKSWNELLLNLVPTWQKKGTNLSTLDWPKNSPFSKFFDKKVSTSKQKGTNLAELAKADYEQIMRESIEEVPSWKVKSTNLLHKKADYLLEILFLTAEAIKLDELMKMIDYKNKNTFRNNYLDPLQQAELIRKTIPDNPNDPEQKYIITENGKLFLAGREFGES